MKPFKIFLVFLLITSCASGHVRQTKENFDDLILSGKDVFFKDVTFENDIDLTKFDKNLISEGVYQVRVVSSITFQDCIFKGKVITYKTDKDLNITLTSFQSNVTFLRCNFHDEVNFRASSILGRTDFTGSLFLKGANFEECTFFQNAYFRNTAFHEEVRFHNSVFMQKANFLNAEFDVTASFQSSSFNSEAQFSSTKFMGYTDFGLIRCSGNFFLNYAVFSNRAIFNYGSYYGQADMTSVTLKTAEMKNCRFFNEVRFSKSVVEERITFTDTYFLFGKPDLSSFDMQKINTDGVKWNE